MVYTQSFLFLLSFLLIFNSGCSLSSSVGGGRTSTDTGTDGTNFSLIQRKLSVGSNKTSVVASSFNILIWGNNYNSSNGIYGQLGIGSLIVEHRTTPSLTSDSGNFLSISLGESTACALTSDQNVKCWGGYTGTGTSSDVYVPTEINDSSSIRYIDISSGSYHSCALTELGAAKCWGDGFNGKLGNSATSTQNNPVDVFPDIRFKQITAGRNHTCAINESDQVMCWGANSNGQLGIGSFATPQYNATLVADSETFKEIDAGENSTCGITTAGAVKCWGNNSVSQLGNGTTTNSHTPVLIDVGVSYKKIAVGGTSGFHVCGITTNNKLKCWGSNSAGQIGQGIIGGTQSTPLQVGTADYEEVSAHGSVTCAVTTGRQLYCWGLNNNYQIGDGTNVNRSLPQLIVSGI